MLTLKKDVQVQLLQPQMVLAAEVVNACYQNVGVKICQITSGSDGAHMSGSLHYQGRALDFSLLTVNSMEKRVTLVLQVESSLGPQYQVLYEAPTKPDSLPARLFWKSSVLHLHVEYNPKLK